MQLKQFKSDIVPLRQQLYFLALKWMQNEADAEDVVQETLLRLWNMREQLDTIANPAAFAMQITKNNCIDRLRAKKETVEIVDFLGEATNETPYSHTETNDKMEIVRQIIARLPELQRVVITMRDIEGYELQEIAEITGTQTASVTMNLSRARKKVREEFININNYKGKTE